ncbi:MAG: substrate-binding domain-containing protein [Acidobacteriia bacterium]|nr:substrate-binding domain-containing protein [Terriglobia bacterium]
MKKLRFVVSLPNDNSYQHEQAVSAAETAGRLGAEVQILHANNDAVTQSQQVLEIIQSRSAAPPDAILFEPLTTTGLVRAAEAAVAASIGWVVLNSDVDYLDRLRSSAKVPIFSVTRDHTEIGRIQGRQFAALLPEGGTVLYVQGPANNSAALQRTIGMESTKPSNILIKALRSAWEEASACQTVSSWLSLSTSRASTIGVVGCQYDGIAKGARKAFENLPNRDEREQWLTLPFTGVDGLPREGKAWVDQGILAATVISLTTTQVALQMLVQAITTGTQPPIRTLIDLASYPSLEKLSASGKLKRSNR